MGKNYGTGENQKNPFFPEEKMYEGKGKSIVSPHGSIFDVPVSNSNVMDERLKGSGRIGKTSHNESAPARKSKKGK